jgi:hypothetical protein
MANDTDWPVFVNIPLGTWVPFVEGGEDVIDVCQEAADQWEVSLETTPNVTWIKRIRILNGSDELATVTTQDKGHGPVSAVFPAAWTQLEFVKGKAFGIPTGMYVTPPTNLIGKVQTLSGHDGGKPVRYRFRWKKD